MTIRPATPDDMPFMMNIERSCPTAAHWSEQQYAQLFEMSGDSPKRLALVAEGTSKDASHSPTEDTGKNLLGFLVARLGAGEWELENIVVSLAVRRKGLGLRLLDNLLTHARETTGTSVFLEVRESNTAARSLYHRAGFRETGRRKSYYTNPQEDAILCSWTPH
jgi:[ribosomal protein S18]-alanine N-acetyltransferase